MVWAQMFDVDLVMKCLVYAGGLDANCILAQKFQDSERLSQSVALAYCKELAA